VSRADFLKGYAENILGRSLTDKEAEQVCAETNRRKVQDLCAQFAQKPKSKPKKKKEVLPEPIDESMDDSIKAVVNDDEV
jgi:molybdopterin converting factor small subunit